MISVQVLLVPKSDHDEAEYFVAIDATNFFIVGVLILNDAARYYKILYLLDQNIERL